MDLAPLALVFPAVIGDLHPAAVFAAAIVELLFVLGGDTAKIIL
jgi:hypothetical protein